MSDNPNMEDFGPPGTFSGPPPSLMPPGLLSGPPPIQTSIAPPGTINPNEIPSLMSLNVGKPAEDGSQRPPKKEVLVLPKAIEDVLALKEQRAHEFEDEIAVAIQQEINTIGNDENDDEESDQENHINAENVGVGVSSTKPSNKNRRKKQRKKQNKQKRREAQEKSQENGESQANGEGEKDKDEADENDNVEVDYVPERITIADLAPMHRQFYRVFEAFRLDTKLKEIPKDNNADKAEANKKAKDNILEEDDEEADEKKDDGKEKISKRKLKKLTRLSVAELKQLVARPDVVEMHDVTARDPKLLVQLKAHRNTVQVPRHWCFKRKYLQGKRGIEKPPFDLPAFIKKTGIMEMRASLQEKEEAKTLKAKMRERVRPKMGKIDIDYQKLHDAFFKWQTKPRMTIHGDLYYEGKEFETRLREKKPGDLSEELRTALGMPVGPACHKIPPPWLIAQQRYGPPPSYPNLKIPGLNAPIPEGCSFGYHAGGWGKPPVDENGKPLYGDVFGTSNNPNDNGINDDEIDRNLWGELESESEESESEEEEEEEGEDLANQPDETGLVTPAEGLVTPSGLTSGVPPGMETPDNIELRKKKIEAEMEDNETPVLYQVIPEKKTDRLGTNMMASTHVYDISAAINTRTRTADREGMVELALDPSELDLDNDAMAQRYEQQMREQQSHLQKEDLSDMIHEHIARQKSKRKRQQTTDPASKTQKKYKEFKF